MSLAIAVDRLNEHGWQARGEDLLTLPDGRAYPGVAAVQREFARAGLKLSIKHNTLFNCVHATWVPADEELGTPHVEDERHGTVIGASDAEAAVYALSQLLAIRQEQALASV